MEIDAASHTGVDNIREEILYKSLYPPTQLKKKVYVIDEVHMLSKGAFNALLKTIEEPQDNVCFILATTEIHKIPETIISRCQVFNFKKVPSEEMIKHLQNICTKEEIAYENDALELIATMSEGCVRDAVKYVDQVSILGKITQENVSSFLGVAPNAMVQKFLDTIKTNDRETIFSYVDTLQEQAIDLHNFVKQILLYIDQHLLQDIDFLLAMSKVCTEILQTIRYYPYPTIVYKVAINNYLHPVGTHQGVSSSEVVKQPRGFSPGTKEKKEEEKKPVHHEEKTDTTKHIEKAAEPKHETHAHKGDITEDNLLSILLEKIEKPSLRTTLKDHVIIDVIHAHEVHMVVINKMTHLIVSKQETIDELQSIISDILGKTIKLTLSFEKKEDYFHRKLS